MREVNQTTYYCKSCKKWHTTDELIFKKTVQNPICKKTHKMVRRRKRHNKIWISNQTNIKQSDERQMAFGVSPEIQKALEKGTW